MIERATQEVTEAGLTDFVQFVVGDLAQPHLPDDFAEVFAYPRKKVQYFTGGGVGGDQRPQASHSGQQADSGHAFRPRFFSSCVLTIQNRPTHRGIYPIAAKALGRCC
jgi:hypothetical protein